MANRQPNNNTESGGLNIVFESGSSGRENKRYVRSHAAKVGWSQRTRNKSTKEDTPEGSSSRKRRKTQSESAPGQSSSQQAPSSVSQESIPPTIKHDPLMNYRHKQHHVSSGDPQSIAYPAVHAPTPGIVVPQQPSIPRLPPPYQHHPGPTQIQEPLESLSTNTLHQVERPLQSPSQAITPWHGVSDPYHHVPAGRQGFVSQFRPTALASSTNPQNLPPASPAYSLPSPQPSPSAEPQAHLLCQSPSSKASWRQYDDLQYMNTGVTQPGDRTDSLLDTPDKRSPASPNKTLISPPSTRPSSPAFLELVLNEEYPLWKPVDSGNDSFGVFPVAWQPFYSRLLENYRSNMLVQLDEILTGWSVKDKIEFNQMPLRLAASEPALFYSILAAASIMMPPGLIDPTVPRWLQSRTVDCLNQAFSDPNRAYSDATILTVNLVALFESTVGNAHVTASLHQPFLRKMVDSRGGLKSLSASNTLDALNLVRFLAWTDRVIRCQTGNKLMFSDFKEDASVSDTNWDDIWARMERRVEENVPAPVQELPDDD